MAQTFNQFQKELKELGIEGNNAYFFTLIYERLGECEQQLTMCANLLHSMAGTMNNFAELSKQQQYDLRKLMRGGRPDGVEVESVVNKPEN